MSDIKNYKGIAKPEMYEELMTFLNKVFGIEDSFPGFENLLPKLYKKEQNPCESNYVIYENGKMVAAVGVYKGILKVGTEELTYAGIGNVAVEERCRNRGLMRECMEMALGDMAVQGVDFIVLGGQRQRYGYYGFETVGIEYRASINRTNVRHVYHGSKNDAIEIRELDSNNQEILDTMYQLHISREFHSERQREHFADIMYSWCEKVRVILKNGRCVGYFTGNMQELTLENMSDFPEVISTWLQENEETELIVPAWDYKLLDVVSEWYEYLDKGATEMFCILNYCKVLKVLLTWKAQQESLSDGQMTLKIHGDRINTKLMVKMEDNIVSVEEYEDEAELILSPQEAMQLFFGLYSDKRRILRPEIRTWFPLPIYIEHADEV